MPPKTTLWLGLLVGCADVGAARLPTVYQTDDRIEVYEAPDGVHRAIAESAIAMQMSAGDLDMSDPSNVVITYEQTLGEAHVLCADVAFQDQIEPGTCSGTLIDDRHVLTAGHCVSGTEDCDGASWPWVFGFYFDAPGTLRTLSSDDVYYCVDTVVFQNDALADYAVIELDRSVIGHAPATLGTTPAVGTPVTLIGHPNGIPMKIAGNATINVVTGTELFADVDAFFGNSGSGVFDDAGEVVGILVAGAPRDYRQSGSGCREVFVIDSVPAEGGETLTDVSVALAMFCRAEPTSPVCEGHDGGVANPDAGMNVDAGALDAGAIVVDAGARVDAGVVEDDSGCGCRAGSRGGSAAPLFALAILALLRRSISRRV